MQVKIVKGACAYVWSWRYEVAIVALIYLLLNIFWYE